MGRIMLNKKTGEIKESTLRWRPEWDENPDDWVELDYIDHRYPPHNWYYTSAYCKRCKEWHARGWVRYGSNEAISDWKSVMLNTKDCKIAKYVFLMHYRFRVTHIISELLREYIKKLSSCRTPEEAEKVYKEYERKVIENKKKKIMMRRMRRKIRFLQKLEILKSVYGNRVKRKGYKIFIDEKEVQI